MQDYDEAIAFLGDWGTFQRTVLFLLSLIVLHNGYTGLSMVFLADTPQHHCRLPDSLNGTTGEPCVDGWEYSTERYISTIVTQWDLVCENNWKGPFTTSVFFLGGLCGSLFSGQFSDRYGRKTTLFIGITVQLVFGLLETASQSWEMFCVLHFVVGFGSSSIYISTFVLGSEILSKSARVAFGTLGISMFFAFGYMLLSLAAYYARDWCMLTLALFLPKILYVPFWWFIPESPRWLFSHGRVKEAEAILQTAAKKNGIRYPGMISELQKDVTNNILNGKIKLCFMLCCRFVVTIGYYGLSLNTSNLYGDPYINCCISGFSEIGAYLVAWWLLHKASRRIANSSMLLVGGALLLLTSIVPANIVNLYLHIIATALAMIGKLSISATFAIIFVYSSELYPTVVRNMGIGTCCMTSRIGAILAPYFVYLGTFNKMLPIIIMGILTLIAGVLSLILPESREVSLPEIIEQVQPLCCAFLEFVIVIHLLTATFYVYIISFHVRRMSQCA
uniref:Solute carrier family 22 member 4-like n=1 Tax=Callorhinchus milii TaxID=7868 RepID=A0A4W3IUU0_CALMI